MNSLAESQEQMRQAPQCQSAEVESEQHLTSEQVAETLHVSTDTVSLFCEGRAGVLDFGSPERRNKRIRRMLRIPPSAWLLVQAQSKSKAPQWGAFMYFEYPPHL